MNALEDERKRNMEEWYVLNTTSGREEEAAELLKRAADHRLWTECRILKKRKVFRSGGILHLIEEPMFPGYLFIKTEKPKELSKELKKARKFPQLLEGGHEYDKDGIIPIAESDLAFLKNVCGENLQSVMGITRIALNEENRIVRAAGALNSYLSQIVKLNLRKRFAIVEVNLFHRKQEVLFGLCLEKDRMDLQIRGR